MELRHADIKYCIMNGMIEREVLTFLFTKYPHIPQDTMRRILKRRGIMFPVHYIEYYQHKELIARLTPDRIRELHAISVDSFVPLPRTEKGLIQKGQHKKYKSNKPSGWRR